MQVETCLVSASERTKNGPCRPRWGAYRRPSWIYCGREGREEGERKGKGKEEEGIKGGQKGKAGRK